MYKIKKERIQKNREEIIEMRIQNENSKYIKETYFDKFRNCSVKEVLENDFNF